MLKDQAVSLLLGLSWWEGWAGRCMCMFRRGNKVNEATGHLVGEGRTASPPDPSDFGSEGKRKRNSTHSSTGSFSSVPAIRDNRNLIWVNCYSIHCSNKPKASREKDQMATAAIQSFREDNGPSIQTTQYPWGKATVQALLSPALVYTVSESHATPKAHPPHVPCKDQSIKN